MSTCNGSDVILTVVIPTYNEADNIGSMLDSVRRVLESNGIECFEIIVVDDDSPDGTHRVAEEKAKEDPRIRVIVRRKERGLAKAVLEGFRNARGEYIAVMDADFQHPPDLLPVLLRRAIEDRADIVVASRYSKGGGVEGWSRTRLFMSRFSSILARLLVPRSGRTSDPMSGFFLVRRSALNLDCLRPRGYKILLEILARSGDARVIDVPYVFRRRRSGSSKLGPGVMLDYILHLMNLSIIAKFMLVGGSGALVNLGVMKMALEYGVLVDISSILGIETSIIWNYILHEKFTFRYNFMGRLKGSLYRLLGYHYTSIAGSVTTYGVMRILYTLINLNPIIAQAIGILTGFMVNYKSSRRLVWRMEVCRGNTRD